MDGTKFEFRIERIFERGGGGGKGEKKERLDGIIGDYKGINDILESGMFGRSVTILLIAK